MGISFIPIVVLNGIVFNCFYKNNLDLIQLLLIFLVAIMTMGAVGLIDDLIGNRTTLGLRGHLRLLLKGKLTTGGLKALVGGLISLLVSSLLSFNMKEIILNTLILALFTNFLNLLDLRPGRAIKGFLFISTIFIFTGLLEEVKTILISFMAYTVAYLPQDIRGKSMMGDVGSNSLGIILGIVTIINYKLYIRYIVLGLLVLIHLVTEKYSLSEIIEKNFLLKFLDELGR